MPRIIPCRNVACGQKLRIPDKFALYDITCPSCGSTFRHDETPQGRTARCQGPSMPHTAFTHEQVAAAIRAHQDTLFRSLRDDVRQTLERMSPAQALSFRLLSGETAVRMVVPAASVEFAQVLLAFGRSTEYDGYSVDSAVTPIVLARVEQTLLDFFASPSLGQVVAEAVLQTFGGGSAVRQGVERELDAQAAWLRKELQTLVHFDCADSVALQLANVGVDQLQHFLVTGVGRQLVVVISKLMATAAGKTFVLRALQVAIGKVMASVAFKAALVSMLRKVGIGILIKTAVGKALIALLAALGLAHVPVFWVLIPVLVGFMAYEYHQFPARLAARLPDEVERIVREQFLEISDSAAKEILKAVLAELVERLTEVRFT